MEAAHQVNCKEERDARIHANGLRLSTSIFVKFENADHERSFIHTYDSRHHQLDRVTSCTCSCLGILVVLKRISLHPEGHDYLSKAAAWAAYYPVLSRIMMIDTLDIQRFSCDTLRSLSLVQIALLCCCTANVYRLPFRSTVLLLIPGMVTAMFFMLMPDVGVCSRLVHFIHHPQPTDQHAACLTVHSHATMLSDMLWATVTPAWQAHVHDHRRTSYKRCVTFGVSIAWLFALPSTMLALCMELKGRAAYARRHSQHGLRALDVAGMYVMAARWVSMMAAVAAYSLFAVTVLL